MDFLQPRPTIATPHNFTSELLILKDGVTVFFWGWGGYSVQAQSPKAPRQTACDICELVVNFLKPYVDNNSTEVSVCLTQHQVVYTVQLTLPSSMYVHVCLSVCLQNEVKGVVEELCTLLPSSIASEVCDVSYM